MQKNKRILVLTDLGSNTGMGHFSRTSALVSAFIEQNWQADFYLNMPDAQLDLPPASDKINYYRDTWLNLEPKTPSRFLQTDYDLAIIDSYLTTNKFIAKFAELVPNLPCVIMEDFQGLEYPKNYIIHDARLSPTEKNRNKQNFVLADNKYILVRSQFCTEQKQKAKADIQEVVLMFGGSDYRDLSCKILDFMQSNFGDFKYKLVIGAAAKDEIKKQAWRLAGKNTEVFIDPAPNQLATIMQNADLSISAAGQTLLELATSLTPIISIEIIDNQAGISEIWQELGMAKFAGKYDDANLLENIKNLVQDLTPISARQNLIDSQTKYFDGKGNQRSRDAVIEKFQL